MTKPVIVTRAGKGLALSYDELDANFTNLQNATINFTGDAGDTRSMDLNDTTDFEGQKNIKITVDEATQKIYVKNTLSDYAIDPIGFENLTDATISFNTSTRTFTIQPTTTSYNYWWKGTQRTVTTTKTVVIPNTTGQYLIYFNDETLSYKLGEPDWSADVPVSYLYWNATAGQAMFSKELHTISMDWKTKEYLHETQAAAYADGLDILNYTVLGTGANNTDAQFDISNGVIYDQDIAVAITHSNTPTANTWQQDLQGPARIPVLYQSGATGTWVRDAARDYAVKNGVSLVTYNLNTAGTWTTPDATSTHYVAYWIVATNFVNTPVISIMGQRTDNKVSDAETNNTWASLDLTNFPAEELRPLYRVIFRTGSTYANTPKAYIASVDDFRFSTIIPQGGISAGVQTVSGTSGRISSTGGFDPVLDLVTTGVSAGSYTNSNVTVDAYGRITSITNGTSAQNTFSTVSIGGTTNLVADSTTDTLTLASSGTISIIGSTFTDTATFDLVQLSPNPAGTYGSTTAIPVVTVDAYGRVTGVTTASNVSDITNTYSVTTVTTSIDLRNGTNTSLLSTIRKTMVFKCAPGNGNNVQFYLPNYQNMNGQYGEFTFIFVPNLDAANFATKYLFQVIINDQGDNLVKSYFTTGLSDATGAPTNPSSSPGTLTGSTTISGGSVTSATIPDHYGQLSYGTAYYANPVVVTVQAPQTTGVTAVLKPIFNGNIIDRMEVVNPGSGYTSAPTFTVSNVSHYMILNPYDCIILRARFIPDVGVTATSGVRNMWILEKIMDRGRQTW